jgi:DNA-binding MarR family transcriptional regulator
MENKKLGIILIVIGAAIALTFYAIKIEHDSMLDKIIAQQTSCFLEDGTCLHAGRNVSWFIFGWIISTASASLGIYLIYFEKSQKEIISALERHKQIKVEEEKFGILQKAMSEEEKCVVNAVKEQDGITQQTLRLRTGLHKSKLSIVLGELEKKGLIAREDKGKTKQVFLKINI